MVLFYSKWIKATCSNLAISSAKDLSYFAFKSESLRGPQCKIGKNIGGFLGKIPISREFDLHHYNVPNQMQTLGYQNRVVLTSRMVSRVKSSYIATNLEGSFDIFSTPLLLFQTLFLSLSFPFTPLSSRIFVEEKNSEKSTWHEKNVKIWLIEIVMQLFSTVFIKNLCVSTKSNTFGLKYLSFQRYAFKNISELETVIFTDITFSTIIQVSSAFLYEN